MRFVFLFFVFILPLLAKENQKFVIIIPSYNNEKYINKNLTSVLNQDYENYEIIYIDDASKDKTYDISLNILSSQNKVPYQLIRNTENQGALSNIYNAVSSLEKYDVVVTVDGDDWLATNNVLNILNDAYSDNNVWLTYGSFESFPKKNLNICQSIPREVIISNSFRNYKWVSSHLRTFYAGLFQKIKKEDLMHDKKFIDITTDQAYMFPMLEMAGDRLKFIDDITYIYNIQNPINDFKIRLENQQKMEKYIRGLPKYKKIDNF